MSERALDYTAPMRWAALSLALVFALGSLSPCPPESFAAETLSAHAPHATARAEAPGHGTAPAPVIKAVCLCGCDHHGPRAQSLGSLGIALPSRGEALPPREPARVALHAPPPLAGAPERAIEKVPRAA